MDSSGQAGVKRWRSHAMTGGNSGAVKNQGGKIGG